MSVIWVLIISLLSIIIYLVFALCKVESKLLDSQKQIFNPNLKHSYSGRYVHFTNSGIKVDIDRYLKTEEGKAALLRLEKSSEKFRKKN